MKYNPIRKLIPNVCNCSDFDDWPYPTVCHFHLALFVEMMGDPTCPICRKKFQGFGYLLLHKKNKHGLNVAEQRYLKIMEEDEIEYGKQNRT